ncbi:gluconokinase [soil metagenome]
MKSPIILALDIGTSSVRAALYDGEADLIPQTSVKIEYSFTSTVDGGAEIDTTYAIDRVVAAIDQVLKKTIKIKGEIEYVASCSFWHSLVGVDARGNHTPVVLGWADTRSRAFTDVLKKRFDESATHNRTGARFHSSYWPAKLMWLRSEFPDAFSKAAVLLSFSDLLSLRFFGEMATGVSMASGTGIFDIRKCTWDSELIRFLKIKLAMLPTVAAEGQTFQLNGKFAKRWPRLADSRWFPVIGDGAADNIGSECVTGDRAALMIGTSGAMRVAYKGGPPTHIPDGLWCYRIDKDRVILGGALSDGGGFYRWLKTNLKIPPRAEDEMRRRGAASHGIIFLPFLSGERSTGYNDDAKGAILGLTMFHDSVDILQAGIESVAYRFAEIFDRLNSIVTIKQIVASGGALKQSPVWTKILADVLGCDLVISPTSESSSRGAVLLALESIDKIGKIENIQSASGSNVAYHPECHAIYRIARKQHQKEYDLESPTPK